MNIYFQEYSGEIASLATACLWTVTALAFESASVKVGSLPVNFIRLVIGFIFLSIFNFFYRQHFLPVDASFHNWNWLIISGLIGFVFGDLFLFRSYTIIGSRFAMLIMTLVPPITAFLGWIFLGEKLSDFNLVGMILTLTGISVAVINKKKGGSKISFKLSPKGMLFAFAGALGQAAGLIASKYGMQQYDPFAATQIRIIAGIFGFIFIIILKQRKDDVIKAIFHIKAMKSIIIGSFFGLFMGVSLSQYAIQHTETGIASTIMSLVPVLIIPPAVMIYKQKVTISEIAGAIISILGVSLFFVKL